MLLEPSPLSPALARRVSLRPPQLSKGGVTCIAVVPSWAAMQRVFVRAKQAIKQSSRGRLVEAIEIGATRVNQPLSHFTAVRIRFETVSSGLFVGHDAPRSRGPQQFDRRAYDDASPNYGPPPVCQYCTTACSQKITTVGGRHHPSKMPIPSPCQTLFKWKPHPNAMVKLHGLSEMPRYSLQHRQGVRDLVNLVHPSWPSLCVRPPTRTSSPPSTQNPGSLSPAGSVVIACGGD